MKELLKYAKEMQQNGSIDRDVLEYRYNICKKILPSLKQFDDPNINLTTEVSYNESIKMVGEFFGSIDPELESEFHNIVSQDTNDISYHMPKPKNYDFLMDLPEEIGHTVKITPIEGELKTANDYFYKTSGSSSAYNYTKLKLNGHINDVNTIAHEFGHRMSLSKGAYFGFGETTSILAELKLYDYYEENGILSKEELFDVKKIKFTPYLYKIAVPTIVQKNIQNIIKSGENIDEATLRNYIESLDPKSPDRYAMEFAQKEHEVLDPAMYQGFEYIEGVLLASHLKKEGVNYTSLLTKFAHCTDNKDIMDLFSSELGIDVEVVNGELRIGDSAIDTLVADFDEELKADKKQEKNIWSQTIKTTEQTTRESDISSSKKQVEKLLEERQKTKIKAIE